MPKLTSMTVTIQSIPKQFSIAPYSTLTTLSLIDLLPGQLSNNNKVVTIDAGIPTVRNLGSVVQSSGGGTTTVNFKVNGATDTPPTYAFNSANVTVSNMTVASNQAIATSNNASVNTLDYVASGDVSQIQPIAKISPVKLSIASDSTSTNPKFTSPTSGLLTNGSKFLAEVNGVVSEYTAGAVTSTSGASSSFGFSGSGRVSVLTDGNIIVRYVFSTGLMSKSVDGGATWTSVTAISGSSRIGSGSYGNGVFVFMVESTVNSNITFVVTTDGTAFNTFVMTGAAPYFASRMIYDGTQFVFFNNSQQRKYTSTTGLTWSNATISGLMTSDRFGQLSFDGVNKYVFTYSSDNTAATTGKLWYSNDNGITWSAATTSIALLPSRSDNDSASLGYGTFISGVFYGAINQFTTGSGGSVANNFFKTTDFTNLTQLTTASNVADSCVVMNGVLYTWSKSTSQIYQRSTDGTNFVNSPMLNNWTVSSVYAYNGVFYNGNSLSSTATTYSLTSVTPSLAANPTAAYLGGQVLQYSVSSSATPSFNNVSSPTYSRSGDVITITGANVTSGLAGSHVQVRLSSVNNNEIVSDLEAVLTVTSAGYTYTATSISPPMSQLPDQVMYFNGNTSYNSTQLSINNITYQSPNQLTTAYNPLNGLNDSTGEVDVNGLNPSDIISKVTLNQTIS